MVGERGPSPEEMGLSDKDKEMMGPKPDAEKGTRGGLTPAETEELDRLQKRYKTLDAGGGLYPPLPGSKEEKEMDRIWPRMRELEEKAKTPEQREEEARVKSEQDAYYGGGTLDDWMDRMAEKINSGELKRTDIEGLVDQLGKLDKQYQLLRDQRGDAGLQEIGELTDEMKKTFEKARKVLPDDYHGPRVDANNVDKGHGDNLREVIANFRSLLTSLDTRGKKK